MLLKIVFTKKGNIQELVLPLSLALFGLINFNKAQERSTFIVCIKLHSAACTPLNFDCTLSPGLSGMRPDIAQLSPNLRLKRHSYWRQIQPDLGQIQPPAPTPIASDLVI